MKTTNKLVYRNNWEFDEYSVDGNVISGLSQVEIGGKKYKVEAQSVSVPYNDMGNTYTATSNHYFIKETVFGIKMRFDLNRIIRKKTIIATQFKVD